MSKETQDAGTDWKRELEQRGQAIADAMGRYRGREPLLDAVARLSGDYHAAKERIATAKARLDGGNDCFDSLEEVVEAVVQARNSRDTVRSKTLQEVHQELTKARQTHAPMNSHHEGYAVILEEVDELWEVCKANTHSFLRERPKWAVGDIDLNDKESLRRLKRAAMRKEALQVAAMAVRFIEDVCDRETATT